VYILDKARKHVLLFGKKRTIIMKLFLSTNENNLFVQTELTDLTPKGGAAATISTNNSKKYQVIDGFGASFTDSSAYLINQVLDKDVKEDLMQKLFCHDAGIGISIVRNPMGSSDYARDFFNYNQIPKGETDFELKKFNIDCDMDDILPLTKQALDINPDLKIAASPWSAPEWMKTTESMMGGELKQECYGVYAEYFVKFIQAYAKEGLPIYYVTPQNEPLYLPLHYPSMSLPAHEATLFIRDHLRPAFDRANIKTKIMCYDHNWDRPDYPLHVFDQAKDAVDGVAWHWYGGRSIAQTQVHMAYPEMEVHFSEGSGGEWIPAFEPAFSNLMRTSIGIMRNHSKSMVLWNMALDENNGPFVPGFGKSTCRGIVKINQQTKELEYTLDYYGLAHYSKYVKPSARRIDSTEDGAVRSVAFENKDGSTVVVLFNDSDKATDVKLNQTELHLPARSALTIVY